LDPFAFIENRDTVSLFAVLAFFAIGLAPCFVLTVYSVTKR